MSEPTQSEIDRLRQELSAREAEMVFLQANGEDFSAVHEQVMALRARLQAALAGTRPA